MLMYIAHTCNYLVSYVLIIKFDMPCDVASLGGHSDGTVVLFWI